MFNNDFMNFMGYRNMVVEEKIEKCLAAKRSGMDSIKIERGDLTDSEVDYLQKEIERRIRSGKY